MEVKWRLLLIGSYVGSGLMFLVRLWTLNILQQSGPSDLSFYSGFIALGLLMFGIIASLSAIREGEAKPRRPLIGSALLSGGIVAVILDVFLYGAYSFDSTRCLDYLCDPSTQLGFQEDFFMIVAFFVIGLVAAGSGGWLLRRRTPNQRM